MLDSDPEWEGCRTRRQTHDDEKERMEETHERARQEQVALLVDGDNLKGQSWTTLLERAREFGSLAVARIYMDFGVLRDGGLSARAAGFEPIHVLGKRSGHTFKSMVDVSLATDAMALLYENPNITTLIIGSGDADFIPLLHQWKRRGKLTVAMSNASQLSTELGHVADAVVTFGEKRKSKSRKSAPMTDDQIHALILELAQGTRLTDRETNQAMVRVEWLHENMLKRYPELEELFPDEKALMSKLKNELDEFLPIDNRARSFLVGSLDALPRYSMAPDDMTDEQLLELFGELCREALPTDGTWLPAPVVLNEGKRLLEDGAGLELPRSRSTGWFRQILEATPGVVVRTTNEGHMEIRRESR